MDILRMKACALWNPLLTGNNPRVACLYPFCRSGV
jgi:hypothetical protein